MFFESLGAVPDDVLDAIERDCFKSIFLLTSRVKREKLCERFSKKIARRLLEPGGKFNLKTSTFLKSVSA